MPLSLNKTSPKTARAISFPFFIFLSVFTLLFFSCDTERKDSGILNATSEPAFAPSQDFEDRGFTPEGPLSDEPNLPPGYSGRDYQKSKYEKAGNSDRRQVNQVKDIAESKKLIKTGKITIEVSSFPKAAASLKKSVENAGGYIESESSDRDYNDRTSGILVIRIPSEKFDQVFHSFGGIGKIFSQSSWTDDITMEYNDSVLRLENLRQLHKRLGHLLATRTGNLKDVAELEEKLSDVTAKIESLKGKLRYYDHNVSMSKIEIYLREPTAVSGSPRTPLWKKLAGGFVAAWELFTGFLVFLIASTGILIPLGAIAYPVYKYIRKRKAQTSEKKKSSKK